MAEAPEFTSVVIKERNSWGETVNVLIVRLIMENRPVAKLLAPLIVLIAFLLVPFALLASRLIPSDFMTSGYLVVAKKSWDFVKPGQLIVESISSMSLSEIA